MLHSGSEIKSGGRGMTLSELLSKAEYYSLITDEEYKELKKQIQPSEDCISRAKALEMLGDVPENWTDTEKEIQEVNDYRWFKSILEELPSVTPHPKMGKWIYEPRRRMIDETDNGAVYREEMWCKCSECGADFGYIKNKDKYCKFCGAKMEVAE
jgi:hypothetical protein